MALADERDSQVEQVDVSDCVDLEGLDHVFFQALWVRAPELLATKLPGTIVVFHSQFSNWVVARPLGLQGSICNDVVKTTASDLGGLVDQILELFVRNDVGYQGRANH